MVLIDLNNISKACWEKSTNSTQSPKFEEVDKLTKKYVELLSQNCMELDDNETYTSFKTNLILALRNLFTLAHIKQIDLNEYFNVSLTKFV